ncbi:hypothetical protein ACROYT_G042086 [Oculina patagonica]
MPASTKGFFINPTLEDDEATSVKTKPLKQEKQEKKAAEKEAGRANAAQGSNRALLALVITMCLISLLVLLLTLLMLFGKIGDGRGCSADEASSAESAKKEAFEKNITSLLLGLMKRIEDLEKIEIKTEAGYNALRDDLNITRKITSEQIKAFDFERLRCLFSNLSFRVSQRDKGVLLYLFQLEYHDAVLTRLKSAVDRTNIDLAEVKSTQTKLKVIYHQTMTPSWLEAHASYINSYRLSTAEQLTFTAGPSEDDAALIKVPMIPANVLRNSTQLTVKIVVSNDVVLGTKKDSDIRYGLSDGISFVGFQILDTTNYYNRVPCFGNEGISGTSFTEEREISHLSSRPRDTFYPDQCVITLKLDAHENWGSCYTAHDGGFVKTAGYNKRLVLNNGLTLEVYKDEKEEKVGIKVIEVTIVEDV